MVVAFHPSLSLDKILIQRSYSHTQKELTSINYLTREQMQFKASDLIKQLHDIALCVSKRECKNAMAQMFFTEIAFVKKTLLAWFNKKFTSQFKELSSFVKMNYKQQNQIDYQTANCIICKIPLKIESTNAKTLDPNMSFGDFIICYEYKFLRNIYTQEQLDWSEDLVSI